ncbi:MAG: hypothetical protein HY892_03590 [Deltaproteobacteria bacterium]|nr:hypothetical protein [Deltaproteobacteria bacterium]
MKKFIVLLTGMAFLLGLTLTAGFAQYGPGKQEKSRGDQPIPSQDTIHLEKTTDKSTKQMQKDIDAIKTGTKAPAAQAAPPAPETKAAVTAAPAADTQPASKDKKKAKKSKKAKTKKSKTN